MLDRAEPGRLFFAIWPDSTIRARLLEWSEAIRTDPGARPVPGPNLHITLVFLGAQDSPQTEAVRRVATEITWSRASLVLDRIGYWKRSRIIWAGSREGSASLSALAADLYKGLRRIGFRIEERPIVPHVTLYRKAQRRPKWCERSIEWSVEQFCLVKSRLSSAGAQYEVLERWSVSGDVK
ncbi:MAG: RNA 2',3'-cyclic phosphodiesterase [Gammaproteobacteria bacterium]|nr:RNA 2',3'-cyclic phosphodiesterase [Gammaproteobacteria bacterium]